MKKTVVAFDFGASSGRAIAGTYQDGRLEYKEVHRFDNIPVDNDGRMCHNFPAICKEVDAALSKINSADGLSFDTWGVDYGLLNKSGSLLRLPCHYRDTRTTAPTLSGTGCPVSRQKSRIRSGRSPGVAKRGSSGSIKQVNGSAARASCSKSL